MPEFRVGEMLNDRFVVRQELGRGSMGVVYRVHDIQWKMDVALKTLHETGSALSIKDEFRGLDGPVHPGRVPLYEFFRGKSGYFFTMELIEGQSLTSYLRGEREPDAALTPDRLDAIRRVFRELVLAVADLHDSGIIHRDLKPTNILVVEGGRPVLLDFGLAKLRAPSRFPTEAGFHGTHGYAAPEQYWGETTERSDWYAIGVLLYECLTGRLPVEPEASHDGLGQQIVVGRSARLPSDMAPLTPPELDAVVVALLDPEAEGRPGPEAVLRALDPTNTDVEFHPPLAPVHQIPFVGRLPEQQKLSELLARSSEGPAVVTHVCGPSGIGKTKLIERFLEYRGEQAPLVFRGKCRAQEAILYRALDPVIDELSRYLMGASETEILRWVPRNVSALLRLFPVLERVPSLALLRGPEESLDAHELRDRGFRALREFIQRLGEHRPIVIWIDDVQWGDRESAMLLREILESDDRIRLLLILSYRDEEVQSPLLTSLAQWPRCSPTDADRIELERLTRSESIQLVNELLHGQSPPEKERVDKILAEANGSPLYVSEMVNMLAAGHTGPIRMSDVIARRIRHVDEGARTLLDLVAVSSGPIPLELALELAESNSIARPAVITLCAQLLLQERVRGDARALEIYHDQIRDALLDDLSEADRRRLHRSLADGFRTMPDPDPTVLLEHYMGAGEQEEASRWALHAGAQAAASLAFDRASELYGLCAKLGDRGGKDWRLQLLLAEALDKAGRCIEAGQAYESSARAAEMYGEDGTEWNAELLEASKRAGQPEESSARILRDVPFSALRPQRETYVTLKIAAAVEYLYGGDHVRGMLLLRESLTQLDVPLPTTPTRARLVGLRNWLRFWVRGSDFEPRSAEENPAEVLMRLDALQAAGHATAMLDVTYTAPISSHHLLEVLDLGETSRALRAIAHAASSEAARGGPFMRKRSDDLIGVAKRHLPTDATPYDRAMVLHCQGTVAYFAGRWRESLDCNRSAVEFLRTGCHGVSWEIGVCETFLIGGLAQLGELEEMSARAKSLLSDARRRGDHFMEVILETSEVVWTRLAADEPAEALSAATAIEQFLPDGFTSQHYQHLTAKSRALRYAGRNAEGWDFLSLRWPMLTKAGFLKLESISLGLRHERGATAIDLARAQEHSSLARLRAQLIRAAKSEAAKLARSGLPHAEPYAASLRAGIANLQGDYGAMIEAINACVVGFDRAEMAMHREASRLQLAIHDSSREADDAVAWLEGAGVVAPFTLAATIIPLGRPPASPGNR